MSAVFAATSRPDRSAHERRVHLIDAAAIRRALLGTPAALRELEQGAAIAICDVDGLDRELTAAGLGITRKAVDNAITRARRSVPGRVRDVLAASMRDPAAALVDAVRARDPASVADILTGLNRQGLAALAVVLADMVPTVPVDRDTDPPRTTAA